jgi:hypothetical protein
MMTPSELLAVATAVAPMLARGDGPMNVAQAAIKALDEVRSQGVPLTMRRNGETILVRYYDKGALLPGKDEQGNRFEAYTSLFLEARKLGDGDRLEVWVQVDRAELEDVGHPDLERRRREKEALAKLGVDVDTIAGDWR